MKHFDKDLLSRIEGLLQAYRRYVRDGEGTAQEDRLVYGLRSLVNLANMILRDVPIFGVEPWHLLHDNVPLSRPGEMLLRLKDYKGVAMPPYPFVMAFYDHGYTIELDTILTLAALREFERGREKQISINVSSRSLRDAGFVKGVLARLEAMDLHNRPDETIIFEIHESTANLSMSRQVLELFRQVGCGFAIDDIGLSMNDILRLSEFDGIADYIKIDRHSVCAKPDQPHALGAVMGYVRSMLPGTVVVAEGAQSPLHAAELYAAYPDIAYVQGLYLPEKRRDFQMAYGQMRAQMAARAGV